jgi:hypothetical protein
VTTGTGYADITASAEASATRAQRLIVISRPRSQLAGKPTS